MPKIFQILLLPISPCFFGKFTSTDKSLFFASVLICFDGKNKNSQTEGVSLACKMGSCRNCSWGRALLNSITIITGTKELLTSRPITCISTTLKTIKFNKNCPKDSFFKKSAILKKKRISPWEKKTRFLSKFFENHHF